jgi:molecular chaperone HtpG
MSVREQGNITIHTENIFPIIKKSLYTDREIFLRELVSNSVDAISKLKMLSLSGECNGDIGEPSIEISIDKDRGTLSIADNGLGMTDEEIKKYINQVAFSSAEEFVEKYQKVADNAIIGHFGLGFYSAFMVASKVEIETLSYREGAAAVHWECDGSPQFTLADGDRTSRGTTIILTLLEEDKEYLEEARIKQLVKTYCDFMSVPISLNGEVINKQTALWKESPQNITEEGYLEFYRYLYPFEEEPLLWVHLNTDYPFLLNGILFFPKLRPDVDVMKGAAKLFCNQVFVSDSCEEIIPKFLTPLRGVIDSPDIPLNVSRSALTNDRTVRRIADYVAKKVADALKDLFDRDRKKYINCWQDIGTFAKFGSLNDEKFKKLVENIIIYRTTYQPAAAANPEGEEDAWKTASSDLPYTTLQEYLDRNREKHENRVFYATDEVTQASYIQLHRNQGLEVLFLDSFIDTHFINFLEREYDTVKFSRVDAELDDNLIAEDKSAEIVDPTTNKTRQDTIKDIFQNALNKPQLNIKVQSLKTDNPATTPPAVVLLPEIMRRFRDMNAMMQQQMPEFPEEHVFTINSSHPLIQNLIELDRSSVSLPDGTKNNNELIQMVCQQIYDLALMSQKGFNANGMNNFVERSNQLLTKLTNI